MQAEPISQGLWLAPHVEACALDGQVILLDLLRNRYMAVPENAALSFEIGGWPPCGSPKSSKTIDSWRIARTLQQQGILVAGHVPVRPPRNLPEPKRNVDVDSNTRQGGGVIGAVRLVSSTTAAALWLRHRNLAAIATSIISSRRRQCAAHGSLMDVDRLSATYLRLRPLVFTSKDQCLLDSLALLRFLAHWQIAATWVIGVKTRPFAAHSWLQSDATVLNDYCDRVRQYRPILIV
ncbi:lasso peptide biosynthesis B2 protein [Piscinibacter sakaiensis]|uniref:lasso peptide biosynthesis B2 protein n=1 Tax=Piscinibacter sakaiensis TaxID=1547922 RepID=UPI003AAFC9C8